jgi:hypothetical protein
MELISSVTENLAQRWLWTHRVAQNKNSRAVSQNSTAIVCTLYYPYAHFITEIKLQTVIADSPTGLQDKQKNSHTRQYV